MREDFERLAERKAELKAKLAELNAIEEVDELERKVEAKRKKVRPNFLDNIGGMFGYK